MLRLWRTAKLQLPKKRPRKRIRGTASDVPKRPVVANQVCSSDFVFDHAANGRQLKCLTVVDDSGYRDRETTVAVLGTGQCFIMAAVVLDRICLNRRDH